MITVARASQPEVADLREMARQAAGCQIVRFTNLPRGFAYSVLAHVDGVPAAYAAVRTTDDEPILIEFYAAPDFVSQERELAHAILAFTHVALIEAQTNIPVQQRLLEAFGTDPQPGPFLFAQDRETDLQPHGATFRPRAPSDVIFEHSVEPVGDFLIEFEGQVVATGGYFTHYNPPYVDLFMEVHPDFRRRGFGSYLLQHIQKECKALGFIAAARCDAENLASKACLERSGMRCCGQIVTARVR